MFAMPLLFRMLIFITIKQCEHILHSKILQVGGGERKKSRIFFYHSKAIVVLSLSLKKYFTFNQFAYSFWGLQIAILASL